MKAISLFAGMGGDTLGLEDAGVDVVAFSEFNADAAASHLSNFPDSLLIGDGDITKTTDEQLKDFEDQGIDIIFAGFPCQGFSHAGKKLSDDPRNTLFREFLRAARLIKPKVVIGENVKGLLSRKNVDGDLYIDIIKTEFEKLGYNVKFGLVKCEDHGVPQKRTRLFIVGTLKDNGLTIESIKGAPYISMDSEPSIGLRDFIEPTLENTVEINLDFIPKESIVVAKDIVSGKPHPYTLLKMDRKETHYWNGSAYEYIGKTFDRLFSFGKRDSPIHCEVANIDKPTKTIICSYAHQPRILVPMSDGNKNYIRPFTINELKQIQSFPKDFKVCGNISSQIKQIGNAVPPKVCTKLIKRIQET